MNLTASQFWAISPAHWPSIESRIQREHSEVIAKRPPADWYGNEIQQMRMDGAIAVVPVKGALLKGASGADKRDGFTSYDDVADDIDASVAAGASAVVLDISSPGGTAVGAGELAKHVRETVDAGTPVYSFTDSLQCSAAEYLSGGCTMRFATADAIVGSIGTIMATMSFERMLDNAGIKAEVITSGKFKGAGHPYKDMTPEQLDYLQGFVDSLAAEFKGWMSKHRPRMNASDMEGQVFTGKQGAANGLIDATSSGLTALIASLKKLHG